MDVDQAMKIVESVELSGGSREFKTTINAAKVLAVEVEDAYPDERPLDVSRMQGKKVRLLADHLPWGGVSMAKKSDAEDRVYRDRPEPARVREIRCMVCRDWLRLNSDGSLPPCENCARNERVKKFRR